VMNLSGHVVVEHHHHMQQSVFAIIGAHVLEMYALVLLIGGSSTTSAERQRSRAGSARWPHRRLLCSGWTASSHRYPALRPRDRLEPLARRRDRSARRSNEPPSAMVLGFKRSSRCAPRGGRCTIGTRLDMVMRVPPRPSLGVEASGMEVGRRRAHVVGVVGLGPCRSSEAQRATHLPAGRHAASKAIPAARERRVASDDASVESHGRGSHRRRTCSATDAGAVRAPIMRRQTLGPRPKRAGVDAGFETLAPRALRERRCSSSVLSLPHARVRRAYAPRSLHRAAWRFCCSSQAGL
jgi:hypothetical protein